MTKTVLPLTIGLLAISFLRAQEISPSPSASATPARAVRISFVPPPLEGKISLGVYNEWSQLVRVLHQEADFDEFAIGADALSTKWDGKDDYDYDLPAGKYSARGFQVAPMKIGAETTTTDAAAAGAKVYAKNCAACHGENAEGKLQRGHYRPTLHSNRVKQATPGELFWLLTNGSLRNGMPSWSHFPEPERWQVVSYLKSLR